MSKIQLRIITAYCKMRNVPEDRKKQEKQYETMTQSMILDKKTFLKTATRLAFPIMIQNLISTLVNAADT